MRRIAALRYALTVVLFSIPVKPWSSVIVTFADGNTFLDRLRLVLGDRKLTPWAQSLGLTKGMVSRIGAGHLPRPDVLSLIARVEGVSLNWLLDGQGRPFPVTHLGWGQAADFVPQLFSEENWTAYLLVSTDSGDEVAVLTLPAQIEVDERRIPYTAVEMLVDAAVDWKPILARAGGGAYWVDVEDDVCDRLRRGLLSPYELVGADGKGGLLGRGPRKVLREEPPEGPDEDVLRSAPPADAADERGEYVADATADLEAAYRRLAEQEPATARRKLLELLDRSLQDLDNASAPRRK